MPAGGENVGILAAIVYVATDVPLCEIPEPKAIALIVVVVVIGTVQGLVHDGEDVVGNPVVE